MKRREFITLLGGAATWPIAARGQSSIPVIGFINGASATAYAAYVQAFIRGLAETGHTVGENVAIEYRYAEGHYDRVPDMVDDLVRRRVAVLAPNTPAAHAAKRAAGAIPVVFFTGEDPVESGLVASLNRPGGNVTGVTSLFGGLAAKQVGLLRDLVPAATLIGFLVNPRNPITERNVRVALDAAQKLGEKIEIVHASSEAEIDAAFGRLRGIRASALLVQPDAFLINKRIVELAARDALPAMYGTRELVAAGGLMSYGPALLLHDFPRFCAPNPRIDHRPGGRNRVGGTMGASPTHWRAAHVNWFTRRGWRKRYRHRHARACAPILSVGSGAHRRDDAVDRTGGSDLGAVPHRMT